MRNTTQYLYWILVQSLCGIILMRNLSFIMSINYLYLYYFASCWFYGSITLWGSHMLSAYYNPSKCEYSRLCHLELILIIIQLLSGTISLNKFQFPWIDFIAHLLDLVCESFLGMYFPIFGPSYPPWKPFASSYFNLL